MVFNTLFKKEIGSRHNVACILLLLAIATARAQVANNLEGITVVGNSAEQTIESVSSSDPDDGYEHFMIRYHLPAGKVTAKNRVVVMPYLIDCYSGMVVDSLEPFVIEGKKYRKRRIRRNDYPRYDVGKQIIEDGKELNIDTTLIVRKLNNKQGHRRVDYTVTLEDYHKVISSYTHTGSCLLRRPFKFLVPTSNSDSSDSTYQEAIIQVKRLHYVQRNLQRESIYRQALATVLKNDYNKAVLYTELEELEKRSEAMEWVDKIDDTNPTKWYLKAILWADKAGQEPQFDGTPYYLAFLHHCLQLDPGYANHYLFDALFSDELRQKYPYKQGDADKYVQLFKKITR